ncbi:hypothetical protein [Bergeyella sp. RCAD1439]|uniref:hypothetical protein n=1 Tax=Bergeyella anatis TaxID=3113737 RepID=UPI002E192440|nr:hypothetical protein [Bergeyella sp. RCAD1439]
MKTILSRLTLSVFLSAGLTLNAQKAKTEGAVGINTTSPHATLDIKAYAETGDSAEGILIPRVTASRAESMGDNMADGTLLYLTEGVAGAGTTSLFNGKGFYYFEASSKKWLKLGSTPTYTAENGLSMNGTTLRLGGTLNQATTIQQNGNDLKFMGNGNVGIGTQSPSQKLEVNGNAKINQMTDATPLESEYTKAVVAKPDGTLGVVSRTNPTVPSGVDVIYGNGAENVDAMEGQTFYDIEKNSASTGPNYTRYTGQSITLPPGKWVVYCSYFLHPTQSLTDNQVIWVRGTISETKENGLFGYISTAVATGSPILISANILPHTNYGTASGIWMINNDSIVAKTYYVKISIEIASGTFINTPTTTLSPISSGNWLENYLFALKRN